MTHYLLAFPLSIHPSLGVEILAQRAKIDVIHVLDLPMKWSTAKSSHNLEEL